MRNFDTVQIVGGGNLENAFTGFGVSATKLIHTYHEFGEQYGLQIWELTKEDYEKFNELTNQVENWDSSKFGWFRQGGVNVSKNEIITFQVKGQDMLGFKNEHNYYHSDEFLKECEEDEEEPYIPGYFDLFEHLEFYWGASKLENVALFVISLAEINSITNAEFLRKYTELVI